MQSCLLLNYDQELGTEGQLFGGRVAERLGHVAMERVVTAPAEAPYIAQALEFGLP